MVQLISFPAFQLVIPFRYHNKMTEMQVEMEKTKDAMEEKVVRSNQDKTERDHKLIMLTSEADRLKSTLSKNEERLEEAERARQTDRTKLLQLNNKVTTLERDLQSARTELEVETAHRMRLEVRLKTEQISQPEASSSSSSTSSTFKYTDREKGGEYDAPNRSIENSNLKSRTDHDDVGSYDPYYDDDDNGIPVSTNIENTTSLSSPANGKSSSSTDHPEGSVEDSIERTQMFIRQRLAARSHKSNLNVAQSEDSFSSRKDGSFGQHKIKSSSSPGKELTCDRNSIEQLARGKFSSYLNVQKQLDANL